MPRYPRTLDELLDSQKTYKPGVLRALRDFKRSRPWHGTIDERKEKFKKLHSKLRKIYKIKTKLRFRNVEAEAERGNGAYNPRTDKIWIEDKLSVVTYLHEFAHAVFGKDEFKAVDWSANLFRRVFPKSAANTITDGHVMLKKPSTKN